MTNEAYKLSIGLHRPRGLFTSWSRTSLFSQPSEFDHETLTYAVDPDFWLRAGWCRTKRGWQSATQRPDAWQGQRA